MAKKELVVRLANVLKESKVSFTNVYTPHHEILREPLLFSSSASGKRTKLNSREIVHCTPANKPLPSLTTPTHQHVVPMRPSNRGVVERIRGGEKLLKVKDH